MLSASVKSVMHLTGPGGVVRRVFVDVCSLQWPLSSCLDSLSSGHGIGFSGSLSGGVWSEVYYIEPERAGGER